MTQTKPLWKATNPSICRTRSPARQRGAAAIMVGIMLVTLVTAMGVTLDIARAYYAQRELQKLANMAAIDAARAIGGCQGDITGASAQTAAQTAVSNSLVANRRAGVLGSTPSPTVRVGTVASDGTFRYVAAETVDGPEDPRLIAAQVNLTAQSPSRVINTLSGGRANLSASSAATNSPQVQFVVRSRLLRLNPGESSSPEIRQLSTDLFSDAGFIDLLNSEDVLDTELSLLNILGADLDIRGDNLVDVGDLDAVGLEAFLDAISDALNGINPAAAGVVDQVGATLEGLGLLGNGTAPSDIFDIPAGQETVAGLVPLNVSDILNSVSTAVLGSGPIAITVAGGVPGVTGVNLTMQILEPPRIAIGRAGIRRRTAQVRLNADVQLALGGSINLVLESAVAEGVVQEIACADAGNDGVHEVTVRSEFTGLASLNADVVAPLLPVTVSAATEIPTGSGGSDQIVFSGPERSDVPRPYIGESEIWPEDVNVGAGLSSGLADLADSLRVEIAGFDVAIPLVGSLLSPLLNMINPVFNLLDSQLNPIADVLGLTIASAEYSIASIQVNADGRPTVDMLIH